MKRTSKYISVVLLGLILINTFSLSLVNIHYELNKDFIIKNYCINTNNPEMNCDGQCHLDELINIVSNNNPDSNTPDAHNLSVISTEFFFTETNPSSNKGKRLKDFNNLYLNNYTFLNSSKIEHPPIG